MVFFSFLLYFSLFFICFVDQVQSKFNEMIVLKIKELSMVINIS